jgi:hypothetical protein
VTLPDLLHEVLRHLEQRPLTDVTVERGDEAESPVGGSEIHQLRFSIDDHVVRWERRSSAGVWSPWSPCTEGFDISDVLAEDWRLV